MENILLAINAESPNWNTLDFACYIAKVTGSGLTAVFLENLAAEEKLVIKKMYEATYIDWELDENSPRYQEKMKLIEQNIERFKKRCAEHGITNSIHRDKDAPNKDLISETRFADVLILDPEMSFDSSARRLPTGFAKKILEGSECPVIIAPYDFYAIDDLVFAYDGSRSAVFAIKQFIHLFPVFGNKKIIVLQVEENPDSPVMETREIEALLKAHYTDIQPQVLQGKPDNELFKYLLNRKNSFVIIGAYGRSFISNLFRHSTAELMMKAIDLPIFIAHC